MTLDPEFTTRMQQAYATSGSAVELGRPMKGGECATDVLVQLPIGMMNRHGLIAGATGTGKTKTLQLLAEQLSTQGVPVFLADIKGDLSGMSKPGAVSDKVNARVADMKLTWEPSAFPVQFLALGGIGNGVPVRAAVSSFGPQLLAKVLGSNDTQTSSLSLVFQYADTAGLPLLDLVDLQALLQYLVSDDGKAQLATIGGLSSSTAGVLLRDISELAQQGAEQLFGEPELAIADLIRTDPGGKGVVSCLELAAVQDKPKLFSTFLMWLLAELFHELPEVGDLDKPKMVFFFDEAHLLFEDASKEFIAQVAQTVRLIRSKGVGVFFITQLPDDIPDDVLAQLGNRIQHALRAFTPRDAKALKAAVTTYPKTTDYDLEEDLTALGIGEAMVTILSDRGAPTPVVWTRMCPPRSLMAAVDTAEVDVAAKASPLWATYAQEIDRESAREKLAAKMAVPAPVVEPTPARPQATAPHDEPQRRESAPRAHTNQSTGAGAVVTGFLKSREGRAVVNNVVRGVFGLLKKR